jgi:hypothetical protein
VSIRPGRYLGLRAGAQHLSFTRNTVNQWIDYDLTPKLQSGTAIVDLHAFAAPSTSRAGWSGTRTKAT